MSDVFSAIRASVSWTGRVLRVGGGLVPLPPRGPGGSNILFVNCEYSNDVAEAPPEKILADARADSVLAFKAIASRVPGDTCSVCVRFCLYDGDVRRENVYACTLPAKSLAEAVAATADRPYWQRRFDGDYPVESSSLKEISFLLSPPAQSAGAEKMSGTD